MLRNFKIGLVCALSLTTLACAEFYNMDFQDLAEQVTIDVNLGSETYTVPVGTLHFESPDIDGSIYGFCSQAHVMVADQLAELHYIMDYDQYDIEQLRKVGYAVQTFFPEVYNQPEGQTTRDTYAAAAQAVVWEILEEADGNYDITSGNIQFDEGPNFSSTSDMWINFQDYFDTMISNLSGMSPDFLPNSDIKIFMMDGAQDFVTITTLPEPATIAILGIGMLFVRKRR